MRSPAFTFLLFILAFVLCGLVGWRLTQGSLDVVFGAPPTVEGELLYPGFKAAEVQRISLSANGVRAVFACDERGLWQAEYPWKDRMDPRFAESIIGFTLGTRVAEVIPKDKIDSKQANFRDGQVGVLFESKDNRTLCKYVLGRKTAWKSTDPTTGEEVDTVFIRPLDKSRKNYIYACNGDIHPLFKDGFKYLRDHQPFLFRPDLLQRIRIRNAGGELTLGREAPGRPWRIIKPLDLPTDVTAMKRLLEGLLSLRAVKVSDRADVTLPASGPANGSDQIAIKLFGAATETILDILPPQSADAPTRLATVDDRPNAIFELPSKANADLVSLSALPLAVNDLRDSTLTNLNIASVKGILIEPAGRTPLLISKLPGKWVLGDGENPPLANERRLFDLLKAVTETEVKAFVTDAATDFTPWGLDKPFLSLRFLAIDNQSLELSFGSDKQGVVYVTRRGTTSVMKVDEEVITRIATQPYQWRDSRLWALNSTDLKSLEIRRDTRPLVTLDYDFLDESWKAQRDGHDATSELDPSRANYLLGLLSNLSVNRWLPADYAAADKALLAPILSFTVKSQLTDAGGNDAGLGTKELVIAPAAEGENNRFYYGRITSDENPFVLDQETLDKLRVELFGEE
ncbi:MAG: DUF4340 domain-containing protein [Verrucomicrobiales bacterium]